MFLARGCVYAQNQSYIQKYILLSIKIFSKLILYHFHKIVQFLYEIYQSPCFVAETIYIFRLKCKKI